MAGRCLLDAFGDYWALHDILCFFQSDFWQALGGAQYLTFLHIPQAKSFPPSTDCSFAQKPQIFPINCSLLASSSLTIRISSLLMPLLSLVSASDLTLIPSLS